MTKFHQSIRKFENNFTVPKATIIIAGLTLASRLLGLIRTRLFTGQFGASSELDTYYTAFRVPDLFTNLLVLGTLSVAFIPVFTEYLTVNKIQAQKLAQTVICITFLGMSILAVFGIIFAGPLTRLAAPGFTGEQFTSTVLLTRIIFLSQVIFSVSNILSSVLNTFKRFYFAGIAPLLYNLGIIIGLLVFYPVFGFFGLGLGVFLGAVMHLIIQIPESLRLGFSWRWRFSLTDPGLKKIASLYIPRIFAVDLSQISLLIVTILGSTLTAGSISVFNLGFDLVAVPVGIFALSTAVAGYPVLAESFAKKNTALFWDTLSRSAVQILFFIIPTSIGLLVLRAHIVRLIYGVGKFSWENTSATFTVLGILACSLFAQSLAPLLARALFARLNSKLPLLVGLGSTALLAVVAYLTAPKFGINGIAFSFSLASVVNCAVLGIILRWSLHKEPGKDIKKLEQEVYGFLTIRIMKIIFTSAVCGLISYATLYAVAPFVNTHTGFGILAQSLCSILTGSIVFLTLSYYSGIEQAVGIVNWLRRAVYSVK